MKKKTIISKTGILAVIMALSMSAVTGCGNTYISDRHLVVWK